MDSDTAYFYECSTSTTNQKSSATRHCVNNDVEVKDNGLAPRLAIFAACRSNLGIGENKSRMLWVTWCHFWPTTHLRQYTLRNLTSESVYGSVYLSFWKGLADSPWQTTSMTRDSESSRSNLKIELNDIVLGIHISSLPVLLLSWSLAQITQITPRGLEVLDRSPSPSSPASVHIMLS